ncbi:MULTISPECIES: hypothetical protein [Betaproteobacteria]|uniref:hypothetical protein n=1 Tax=Betaproteobacteria TaxID=28216 RepID=UPI000A62D20E|nr:MULTISPECIES: hypothetical protein [Betaproteobacteria]MCE4131584.1 hypothetical protein [Burkholderia cepacia]
MTVHEPNLGNRVRVCNRALAYEHEEAGIIDGATVPLKALPPHSTTVYKVQEAFNNVTLPDENVYKTAIEAALG